MKKVIPLHPVKPINRSNENENLEETNHWRDKPAATFHKSQRPHTTVLLGGLSEKQDRLIAAAFRGVGYQAISLPVPNRQAMMLGKEFGNRGQCNPTYFTVGNLIAYLQKLKTDKGLTADEIKEKYVFLTASGCGPCRFGMYGTEYRKALREAGFDGFRLVTFHHDAGLSQGSDDAGLALTPLFFLALLKAIIIGDILNALGYRIRPYECHKDEVNRVLDAGKKNICRSLEKGKNISRDLIKLRRQLKKVKLNRLQVKPKVFVTGEFWAVTTEGEGNYQIQKTIEQEGGEVEVETVSARILHNIWEAKYNQQQRERLASEKKSKHWDWSPVKNRIKYSFADFAYKTAFRYFAKLSGLSNYQLPNMDELAKLSKAYYPLDCQGGEAHLEVAHVLERQKNKSANLVVSIKPFGCLPSSGVSDGVQTIVTAKYPDINFISLETSGDSEANIYSRLQMALHRAKQSANNEFETLCKQCDVNHATAHNKINRYNFLPNNGYTSTASKLLYAIHK